MRPASPSARSVSRDRSSGSEAQLRDSVDLDPVPLLRHREIAASQTGLDVRERNALRDRGTCARERRVRVAVDEHPVGPLAPRRLADVRLHRVGVGRVEVEPVRRLRELELVEEDLRQLRVVVLARVQHDLLDTCVAKRERERRRLHELRAVAHDGEHLHRGQA